MGKSIGRKGISIILSTPLAIILIIWGIPGMMEDWTTWLGWLGNTWDWLAQTPTPLSWVLVIIGIVLLVKPQKFVHQTRILSQQMDKKISRPRLEHDGVLWEDGGNYVSGGIMVIGPLCPKDYTPLGIKDLYGDRIETQIKKDQYISQSTTHLVCPECHKEYTLIDEGKKLDDSRQEVGSRFLGKRRRDTSPTTE
ncbi:hypothetical protein ACFLWZ_03305 [Chloroflexota bacterium]